MSRTAIILISIFSFLPSVALAHGETDTVAHHNLAPDLHPLIVLGEFFIVLVLGYIIANWLANLGRKKN